MKECPKTMEECEARGLFPECGFQNAPCEWYGEYMNKKHPVEIKHFNRAEPVGKDIGPQFVDIDCPKCGTKITSVELTVKQRDTEFDHLKALLEDELADNNERWLFRCIDCQQYYVSELGDNVTWSESDGGIIRCEQCVEENTWTCEKHNQHVPIGEACSFCDGFWD